MIFTTLICEFYIRQVRGNQQQSSKGMSPKTSIVALPVPSSQSKRSLRMVLWLDVWNTVILFYDTNMSGDAPLINFEALTCLAYKQWNELRRLLGRLNINEQTQKLIYIYYIYSHTTIAIYFMSNFCKLVNQSSYNKFCIIQCRGNIRGYDTEVLLLLSSLLIA